MSGLPPILARDRRRRIVDQIALYASLLILAAITLLVLP